MTSRTLSGLFWSLSGTGLKVIMRLATTVVLARLLSPADFGLVATALTIQQLAEISQVFVGPPVVQSPQLETRHIRTAFTITVILGIVIPIIFWILTPALADFFRMQEQLPTIFRTITILAFPLSSMSTVAESLLQRELKFRVLSGVDVASYALGYVLIGPVLAFLGFGVWVLVVAYVVQTLSRSIILLLIQPHPKGLQIEKQAFRDLVYLGGGFAASRFFNYFALQGDYIVVGRWLGASALGLYTRAYNLMALPTNTFGIALNNVGFPALAKVQNEPERLARAFRRSSALVALLTLPASVFMFILAPEIVQVLLGPKWTGVILPFQILAAGTFFRLAYKVSNTLARSKGQIYANATIQLSYSVLVVGGAWLGLAYGIGGVAVAVTIALVINFLLLTQLGLRITSMKSQELLLAHVPALLMSIISLVITTLVVQQLRIIELSDILTLTITACITFLGMAVSAYLAPNLLLGEDGIWWLKTLGEKFSKKVSFKKFIGKL